MVKGGLRRQKTEEYTRKDGSKGEFSKYLMTNKEILHATKADAIMDFIDRQRVSWIEKIIRSEDTSFIKQLTFPDFFANEKKKPGPMSTCYGQVKNLYRNEHNLSEIGMVNSFLIRNNSGVTAQGYNSNV